MQLVSFLCTIIRGIITLTALEHLTPTNIGTSTWPAGASLGTIFVLRGGLDNGEAVDVNLEGLSIHLN